MMLSRIELKKSLLALAGVLVVGAASAAVSEDSAAPSFPLGGGTVYPGLGLAVKSDSNPLRLASNDPNQVSSKVAVLSPSVLFEAQTDANAYSLSYVADIGRYDKSTADNFADQKILGLAEFGLSSSSTLKIQPEYLIGHDDRGTTFGAGTLVPNTWRSAGVNGSFAYGAEESRASAVLDLGYTDRQYQNNRLLTTAYDKKLTNVGGTFYLRVQPKTSLLLHAKQTNIAYAQTGSLLNGNEQRLMAGAKWEASAQTTGEIKVGQLQKKFDTTYTTYTGTSWEGDVLWSPKSFVQLNVLASKKPVETTLPGSSTILITTTGADAAYDLNDRVTLHANGYQMYEEFLGVVRKDTTKTFGFKAEYKFRSWLIGGAEYSNSVKTSNDPLNDYKRNIFMVSVRSVL